jgi:hypothetical protein
MRRVEASDIMFKYLLNVVIFRETTMKTAGLRLRIHYVVHSMILSCKVSVK